MPAQAPQPASTGLRPARVPELDGLRAFAILPVIFCHCYPRDGFFGWVGFVGAGGWMGVDLFFVLSGYLITGILLRTVDDPHYYRNFIVRRALRIFPLYYVCLALFTAAAWLGGGQQWSDMQKWGLGWFVVYLGNVRTALHGFPPVFSFIPLWSLQIEEQFYVLYPLVVLLLSRQNLRRFLVGCVVTAPLLRVFLVLFVTGSSGARYVLMPCRMDALALGGLVAILARCEPARWPSRAQVRSAALIAGFAALAVYAFAWRSQPAESPFHPLTSSLGYSLNGIAFASLLAIVVLSPSPVLAAVLRWRPFTYTGEIAYGLYLLHGPAAWMGRKLVMATIGVEVAPHSAAAVPITFLASYLAAGLSWRYFESPVLALKDRFTSPARRLKGN